MRVDASGGVVQIALHSSALALSDERLGALVRTSYYEAKGVKRK